MKQDDSIENGIKTIWASEGIILPKDIDFSSLQKNAKGEVRNLIFYGRYCGPGTGKINEKAQDCLDFICQLHDRYFSCLPIEADSAFQKSAKYLLDQNKIESCSAKKYADMIYKYFHVGSAVYRNRIIIILFVCILLVYSIVYAWIFW